MIGQSFLDFPHTPATAQLYDAVNGMAVVSRKLSKKCTRDLWCANPLRYPAARPQLLHRHILSRVIQTWGKTGHFILLSFGGKTVQSMPVLPRACGPFYPHYGVKWAISFKFLIMFKYFEISQNSSKSRFFGRLGKYLPSHKIWCFHFHS